MSSLSYQERSLYGELLADLAVFVPYFILIHTGQFPPLSNSVLYLDDSDRLSRSTISRRDDSNPRCQSATSMRYSRCRSDSISVGQLRSRRIICHTFGIRRFTLRHPPVQLRINP